MTDEVIIIGSEVFILGMARLEKENGMSEKVHSCHTVASQGLTSPWQGVGDKV